MTSWRSLCWLLVLLSVVVVAAAAEPVGGETVSPEVEASQPQQGLFGLLKHFTKTIVNGPDPYKRQLQDERDGVERLTDENYTMEVERPFGGGPEDEVWVVLVHGREEDITSATYLEAHKDAAALARTTLENEDGKDGEAKAALANVRWARLDYIADWETCTRWLLTKPPYLIFISDHGRTLRFLRPSEVRPDAKVLIEGIRSGFWKSVPVWESKWAPGGDRAFLVEHYISLAAFFGKRTSKIPGWAKMMIAGLVAQKVLGWLHGGIPAADAPARARAGAGAGAGQAGAAAAKKDQ